jgi:hypothetical protein
MPLPSAATAASTARSVRLEYTFRHRPKSAPGAAERTPTEESPPDCRLALGLTKNALPSPSTATSALMSRAATTCLVPACAAAGTATPSNASSPHRRQLALTSCPSHGETSLAELSAQRASRATDRARRRSSRAHDSSASPSCFNNPSTSPGLRHPPTASRAALGHASVPRQDRRWSPVRDRCPPARHSLNPASSTSARVSSVGGDIGDLSAAARATIPPVARTAAFACRRQWAGACGQCMVRRGALTGSAADGPRAAPRTMSSRRVGVATSKWSTQQI